MNIRTISTSLSSIPLLRHRDTVNPNLQADKDDFVIKYEATNDHLANTTVTELNTIVEEINNTVDDMILAVDEVEANAAIAQSIGNYQGEWNNTTPYLKNQSVSIGNLFYTAKANNTNISPSNTDYWLSNPINNKLNTNISTYDEKTTPINADLIPLCDSADAFAIKKLSWANLKATLSNLFVSKISSPTANALIKVNADGSISNTGIAENNGNLGSGTQTFNGFGGSGFKNYIINGKKTVNQRSLTSTDNSYNQDRWYKSGNNWYQGIEGNNNLINGKTYTLSWSGNATAGYYVGTATSTTINAQSFTSISNGDNFTLTISAGQNLWIKFVSDSTGSTFNFVQLEEGSIATPFEQRPYGLELNLCQRYFQGKVSVLLSKPVNPIGANDASGDKNYYLLKQSMRITPTITISEYFSGYGTGQIIQYSNGATVGSAGVSTLSPDGFSIRLLNGTMSDNGYFKYEASAEL